MISYFFLLEKREPIFYHLLSQLILENKSIIAAFDKLTLKHSSCRGVPLVKIPVAPARLAPKSYSREGKVSRAACHDVFEFHIYQKTQGMYHALNYLHTGKAGNYLH